MCFMNNTSSGNRSMVFCKPLLLCKQKCLSQKFYQTRQGPYLTAWILSKHSTYLPFDQIIVLLFYLHIKSAFICPILIESYRILHPHRFCQPFVGARAIKLLRSVWLASLVPGYYTGLYQISRGALIRIN